MNTISLTPSAALSESQADKLAGEFLDERHYTLVVGGQEDADVIKPNGDLLLRYRANVLPRSLCAQAYPVLRLATPISKNRGKAAGGEISAKDFVLANHASAKIESQKGTRVRLMKLDGTVSNTMYAKPVNSGIIGAFDRSARTPYCRLTAFNIDHYKEFEIARPFIEAIDGVFQSSLPERYEAQMAVIRQTKPDWIIRGTSFTTVTVNKNFRTACHKDKGDLSAGFGVMSVLQAGSYAGGYLVFPRYRVAVDMRTGGVCLADVHEWHGNTEMIGVEGQWERVSVVCYYRARMIECGTPEEERLRASRERSGFTADAAELDDESTVTTTPSLAMQLF